MVSSVELDEAQVREIDRIAKQDGSSRTGIVRFAVETYLAERREKALADAFGSWRGDIEGLEYQERLRKEWDRDQG